METGVGNINIKDLLEYHKSHGKIGTMTGVHPSSRFGEFTIKDKQVLEFNEKPQIKEGYIKWRLLRVQKRIFNYLNDEDTCILEKSPWRI